VQFKAERTGRDWLSDWQQRALTFPRFELPEVETHQGVIAITTHDDLSVRPERIEGLAPMNVAEQRAAGLDPTQTSLTYRHSDASFNAALQIKRKQPRVTAQTLSAFRITPKGPTCITKWHIKCRTTRCAS
jgi:hypothetical protein